MSPGAWTRAALAAVALGCAPACTLTSGDAQVASGPSELGISLTLQASPDVLTRDGTSWAIVGILARDAYGGPVPDLRLRADIMVDGVLQDFGRLSARTLTTDREGRTSLVYTSPEPLLGDTGQSFITIVITASTGDARAQVPRSVDIRLVPPAQE